MSTASKDELLKCLEEDAKKVKAFTPADVDSFLKHVEEILAFDFHNIAPAMDKNKILKTIKKALKEAGIRFDDMLKMPSANLQYALNATPSHIRFRAPLWEWVWAQLWNCKEDPFFVEHDKHSYDGLYAKTVSRLLQYIFHGHRRVDANGRLSDFDFRDEQFVRWTSHMLPGSILWSMLLLHMKGVRRKKGIKSIHVLHDLLENGFGVPFLQFRTPRHLSNSPAMTLELAPLSLQERTTPQIIDSSNAPFMDVMVLKSGALVPEKVWRFPERLIPDDIFFEENVEVRRVMLEVMGNETFIQQCGAQLVDEKDGYKLYHISLYEIHDFRLVHCVDPSTGREYYLRVPPTINDAREAIAWTFNEAKDSYRPMLET